MESSGATKSSKKRRTKGKRTNEGISECGMLSEVKSNAVSISKNETTDISMIKSTQLQINVSSDNIIKPEQIALPAVSSSGKEEFHDTKSSSVDHPPLEKSEHSETIVGAAGGDVSSKKLSREAVKADREAKRLKQQMRKMGFKVSTAKDKDAPAVSEVLTIETGSQGKSADSTSCSVVQKTDLKEPEKFISIENQSNEKPDKSKAELRAERRAKQEAQRAEKEAKKRSALEKSGEAKKEGSSAPVKSTIKITDKIKKPMFKENLSSAQEVSRFRHKLFDHLAQKAPLDIETESRWEQAVGELGAQYASRVVAGSTARTVALLGALRRLVGNHRPSAKTDFARSLDSALGNAAARLSRARPPAVAMTNALKHLKSHVNHLTSSPLPDDEAKKKLCEVIDTYIKEQVDVACLAICNTVQQKISDGDVLLTYGCSSVVLRAMEQAHKSGKRFSVVVADGGPWFEGREMLRRLAAASIPASYILVTAVSFVARKVHKVMLGAHSLLANGCVMARAGTSLVALTAHAHGIPVLVLCETHKFSDRVQADAFVYNELGEPADVSAEEEHKNLTCLSLVYDLTPPELVTAVVTELAILPCTSVPVVLRVKPADIHQLQ